MTQKESKYNAVNERPGTVCPAVSVLIVNFNGSQFLKGCLESLRNVVAPTFEIIVVDNGSTDDSLAVLQQFNEVTIVQSPENVGFAGGNNLGVTWCRGELVLLLNNDTEVSPGFLEPLVNYMTTHPEVGIVQGKMLLSQFDNSLDVCGSFITRFGFLYHYGYYKPDGDSYATSYPVFTGKGACFLFRKSLIAHVGGYLFDKDFFCYYEETDFCHRAWISGHEVHFVAGPPIKHLQGGTSGAQFGSSFPLRSFLRNQTFALLCNLSCSSLFKVFPLYLALFFTGMAASLITFRFDLLTSYFGAFWYCLINPVKILERRKRIKQIRRRSDRAVFAKVMRTPRWSYFWRTFTGKLALYRDLPIR